MPNVTDDDESAKRSISVLGVISIQDEVQKLDMNSRRVAKDFYAGNKLLSVIGSNRRGMTRGTAKGETRCWEFNRGVVSLWMFCETVEAQRKLDDFFL